jgi:hypothetical protein
MKKRIITSMAIASMLVAPAAMMAQNIYLSNEEMVESMLGEKEDEGKEGEKDEIQRDITDIDEFAPLGEGVLLLSCLGGAYLFGRRRKEQNS